MTIVNGKCKKKQTHNITGVLKQNKTLRFNNHQEKH